MWQIVLEHLKCLYKEAGRAVIYSPLYTRATTWDFDLVLGGGLPSGTQGHWDMRKELYGGQKNKSK